MCSSVANCLRILSVCVCVCMCVWITNVWYLFPELQKALFDFFTTGGLASITCPLCAYVCVRARVCVCGCIRVCVYQCLCVSMCESVFVHLQHVCIFVHAFLCFRRFLHKCVCECNQDACVRVCVCVCMYMCVCVVQGTYNWISRHAFISVMETSAS